MAGFGEARHQRRDDQIDIFTLNVFKQLCRMSPKSLSVFMAYPIMLLHLRLLEMRMEMRV